MESYTIYDVETGRIICPLNHDNPDLLVLSVGEGQGVLPGLADPETEYVVNAQFVARPVVEQFDPLDVPAGWSFRAVNSAGTEVTVDDPVNDPLILTGPGTYTYYVVPPFPFKPFKRTIDHA